MPRLRRRAYEAFNREFVTPSGRLASDAPTAYTLAICFDLLTSPEQRERAGRRLVELVTADGHRISTGFVGTPLICDALVEIGAVDDALWLLQQTDCPSWLYSVSMGATTIWERWDSMLPDGSINPGDMTVVQPLRARRRRPTSWCGAWPGSRPLHRAIGSCVSHRGRPVGSATRRRRCVLPMG